MDDDARRLAKDDQELKDDAAHLDPLTNQPGAHPVGAGLGAATVGAAGAAIGGLAGPIGAVAGAVIGGLAGGLAGKEVAENVNPTDPQAEDDYWRQNYRHKPYVAEGEAYEVFQGAYRYGWEAQSRYPEKDFDDVDAELAQGWQAVADAERIEWARAKAAAHDAWHRVRTCDPAGAPPPKPR